MLEVGIRGRVLGGQLPVLGGLLGRVLKGSIGQDLRWGFTPSSSITSLTTSGRVSHVGDDGGGLSVPTIVTISSEMKESWVHGDAETSAGEDEARRSGGGSEVGASAVDSWTQKREEEGGQARW
ncbi:hypothetical protein PIB30_043859 [Stylosanthes scabra]|uniref:Uncharacterized protein n=1 Tax=Stylosanthes scabra TaxID=79078 RepID=A0ABU6ZEF6_9FABA|nr:hypothetical protein [Stylosanthes scabra]